MDSEEKIKNRKLWIERIIAFRESGMEQRPWCEENGVNISALRHWLRKQPGEDTQGKPQWLSVNLNENVAEITPNNAGQKLLIVWTGPYRVEVAQDYDPAMLSSLLRTLQALCC